MEAPGVWSSDANRRLTGKVPDVGEDCGQEEKRASEDETTGWQEQCNEHELGQTPGDGEGQGGLACCGPWGRQESDTAGRLNNNINKCVYRAFQGRCGKEPSSQRRRYKRLRFEPCFRKLPWGRKRQLTPAFLPGKFHGQRSLMNHGVTGNWTQLSPHTVHVYANSNSSSLPSRFPFGDHVCEKASC